MRRVDGGPDGYLDPSLGPGVPLRSRAALPHPRAVRRARQPHRLQQARPRRQGGRVPRRLPAGRAGAALLRRRRPGQRRDDRAGRAGGHQLSPRRCGASAPGPSAARSRSTRRRPTCWPRCTPSCAQSPLPVQLDPKSPGIGVPDAVRAEVVGAARADLERPRELPAGEGRALRLRALHRAAPNDPPLATWRGCSPPRRPSRCPRVVAKLYDGPPSLPRQAPPAMIQMFRHYSLGPEPT